MKRFSFWHISVFFISFNAALKPLKPNLQLYTFSRDSLFSFTARTTVQRNVREAVHGRFHFIHISRTGTSPGPQQGKKLFFLAPGKQFFIFTPGRQLFFFTPGKQLFFFTPGKQFFFFFLLLLFRRRRRLTRKRNHF